jgi:tetratricopeptide (TPR) repeat protein
MEKTRLEMLQENLRTAPANAFVRYGLAMEFKNAGRDQEAWQQFDHLLRNHPDYWAAYYQAGTLLLKMGRRDEARQIMTKGLKVTGQQRNLHAQSELQAALGDLED